MTAHLSKVVVAVVALVSVSATAQSAPRARGQGWSVLSHQTVGRGDTALAFQVGFPGLTVGVLHGLQEGFDLGGRLAVNYSHEGMVTLIHPGLKGEIVGRLRLIDGARFGLGLNFGLGVVSTFAPAATVVGMTLPLGLVAGIPIGSALVANVGLDLPLIVTFGNAYGGLTAPILVGAGLEYFIDRSLLVSFNTRMGPSLNPVLRVGRQAEFTFQAQLGIALKL